MRSRLVDGATPTFRAMSRFDCRASRCSSRTIAESSSSISLPELLCRTTFGRVTNKLVIILTSRPEHGGSSGGTQMWEHEQLVVRTGKRSGMTTMVALHSTEAGPAVGGCRMKPYDQITDAVTDVLRLSKAMTLKCAAAGIPHGGAKSVIVADRPLTPELRRDVLLDHADLINEFGG